MQNSNHRGHASRRLATSDCNCRKIHAFTSPRAQSDGIKSVDLKSPNELTEEEYNSYSGAAIGGTLLMLIPVAYYDGLLFEFAKSFAISALLGGGLGAYLSLRKDGVGEKAGEFGSAVVNKVKEI